MTVPFIHLPDMQGPRTQLPAPNIPMPAGPRAPVPWWQRVQEKMLPVPEGLRGLLSDEDVGSARQNALLRFGLSMLESGGPQVGPTPSLGQALARGVQTGLGSFDEALKSTSQMKVFGEQQKQAAQLREQRSVISQKYPAKPNETAIETLSRVQRMLPEFVAINDTEMVGKLVELLKSQGDLLKPAVPAKRDIRVEDNILGPDGKPYKVWYDNDTDEELKREPQYVQPKDNTAQQGVQQQRQYQRERDLSRDYAAMAKQFGPSAEYYANANASRTQALTGDPIAQHSLIFNYMHVLEPTSVVREGEYAAIAKRNGAGERLVNMLALIDRGTFLPKAQVANLLNELDRLVTAKKPLLKQRMDMFKRRAERWGVPVEDIIFDPYEGTGVPAEGAATPKPSNPLLGR